MRKKLGEGRGKVKTPEVGEILGNVCEFKCKKPSTAREAEDVALGVALSTSSQFEKKAHVGRKGVPLKWKDSWAEEERGGTDCYIVPPI